MESAEERSHWRSVLKAFDTYMHYHLSANHARRMAFFQLPKDHKIMFEAIGYKEKLEAVDEGIRRNAEFIDEMVADPVFAEMMASEESYASHSHGSHSHGEGGHSHTTHDQHHSQPTHSTNQTHPQTNRLPTAKLTQGEKDQAQDKVRSTLRSFVRDWAEEGREERENCYDPCLEALERYFPSKGEGSSSSIVGGIGDEEGGKGRRARDRRRVRVLVPGCGLGRLAMEIAARGFNSQGNEFSTYMLLASHFVLNQTSHTNSHTIYPYLHSFSNHLTTPHHLLKKVSIPDVCPAEVLGEGAAFSLVAGDFEEVYGEGHWRDDPPLTNRKRRREGGGGAAGGTVGEGEEEGEEEEEEYDDDEGESGNVNQKGRYGAVVTCFFIDTARNVLDYLRIIYNILEEDGVWINLGPLLWHFENSPSKSGNGQGSIELSLDEVKKLAGMVGFDIKDERMIRSTYTGVPEGMLRHEYNAAFFTATKRRLPSPSTSI